MSPVAALLRSGIGRGALYGANVARDIVDYALGRRDPLIPPTRLMHDGPRNIRAFRENGQEFFRYYTDLCGLRPHESILDVGCGIGRKTVPLIGYLDDSTRYEGIDIVKPGIDWCQTHIAAAHHNFDFHLIDVFNRFYNPAGRFHAWEYRFPFESGVFDFAVAGSVFTHLTTDSAVNYVREIARTLKPGGRCLLSFFLLNDESRAAVPRTAWLQPTLAFRHSLPGCYTIDSAVPERAVAYDERFVIEVLSGAGLQVTQPIHFGSWCGRSRYLSWQDLVVARKV